MDLRHIRLPLLCQAQIIKCLGKVLFVNTVHDSLKLDVNMNLKEAIEIGKIVKGSFVDIPENYKKIYGKELLVPMDSDFSVGINSGWAHKINL